MSRVLIPDGFRWGDVQAASVNIGEALTRAMRVVADADEELRGVFTVDWNKPAPDGSGKLRDDCRWDLGRSTLATRSG